MKTELWKIFSCIILLVTASTVFAQDIERRWTTNRAISPKTNLRLQGKRGAVIPHQGKTRITIWIDTDTLNWFKENAENEGRQGISNCHQ